MENLINQNLQTNKVNEELQIQLEKLNSNLGKVVSIKRSFFQSIVNGIGTAIGATIVAGIAFAIIYRLLSQINIPQFINQYLGIPVNTVQTKE